MFALAVVTLLGPSLDTIILIVVVTSIPVYGRIVRTQTLSLKTNEFILAERSLGAGPSACCSTHVLPNVIGPLADPRQHGDPGGDHDRGGPELPRPRRAAADAELGLDPERRLPFIRDTPWLVLAGGLPLILTTLGFTFLGEALRDVFDPQAEAAMTIDADPILEIRDLSVEFATPRGAVQALRDVSLAVPRDRVVGVVGESGCGKTTLISAVLAAAGAATPVVEGGSIRFEGADLLALIAARDCARMRGPRIAMVFQDPMTALNPVLSIATPDDRHPVPRPTAPPRGEAASAPSAMLRRVGIADPEQRIDDYPHQSRGGMRQRISIAMALLMNPSLLIADEPTTALDVTIEAQIIHLMSELRARVPAARSCSSRTISGLIAELCDEVVVMYAGEVVEQRRRARRSSTRRAIPTRALLLDMRSRAASSSDARQLPTIAGDVPDLARPAAGLRVRAALPDRASSACRAGPDRAGRVGAGPRGALPSARWRPDRGGRLRAAARESTRCACASARTARSARRLLGIADPFIDAVLGVALRGPRRRDLRAGRRERLGQDHARPARSSGWSPAQGGAIRFDGPRAARPRRRGVPAASRREIAMMFQDPVASLSPRKTVRALLVEPFRIHRIAAPRPRGRGARAAGDGRARAGVRSARYPHQLSGGQARRVGVARALALRPRADHRRRADRRARRLGAGRDPQPAERRCSASSASPT